MKEKMIKGIIIIAVIASVTGVGIFVRSRTSKNVELVKVEGNGEERVPGNGSIEQNYVENQVLCKAESKEEAEKIAETIGGKLIGYFEGMGLIAIEETVEELMDRMEEEGLNYLEIYPNLKYSAKQIGTF